MYPVFVGSIVMLVMDVSGSMRAEDVAPNRLTASQAAAKAFAKELPAAAAPPNEQYFPLQSYRVGPYAAGGSGFFGGFIDYMQLINTRDGGVNGVRPAVGKKLCRKTVNHDLDQIHRAAENHHIAPERTKSTRHRVDKVAS